MNYLSTRDKSLNFNFKDIFLRGLAPDGGLILTFRDKELQ
jgi:threonine synthase